MFSWLKSSTTFYLIAAIIGFSFGIRNLIASLKGFRKVRLDSSTSPEIKVKAKSEMRWAIVGFTAALLTICGRYIDISKQEEATKTLAVISNELAQARSRIADQTVFVRSLTEHSPKPELLHA